jgi:hypothetical protein
MAGATLRLSHQTRRRMYCTKRLFPWMVDWQYVFFAWLASLKLTRLWIFHHACPYVISHPAFCIMCTSLFDSLNITDLFLSHGLTATSGPGLLTVEISRSHSDTPHSVRFLWTSDRLIAKTPTWQHTTLKRDRPLRPRRDSNSQFQQASGHDPTP